MTRTEFPERIWLIDAVEGGGAVGWTAEKPLDPNEPGVAYVRADRLAEARALVEADADEDADVPLAELIRGHFDAYEAEIARLRNENLQANPQPDRRAEGGAA